MIRMLDIAAKAGVSRTTVSFVLNEQPTGLAISQETRQRVLEAARELGYRRNEMARAISSGKTRVIGFLTDIPAAEHVARMLDGALDAADGGDYFIKVVRPRNEQEFDERLIKRCVEMRLAGVVVLYLSGATLECLHQELARYNIPIAHLDDAEPCACGVAVRADYEGGMRLAIEHLADLGHQKIALISGHSSAAMSSERETGFRRAMAQRGLGVTDEWVVDGAWDVERTLPLVRKLLVCSSRRPTAIIGGTDIMALTAMRAARLEGLRIPEDLSVVGFGDLALAQALDPPLTAVRQPFQEMGRRAVKRLLEAIAQGEDVSSSAPAPVERVPTRLMVRESTAHCVAAP